MLTLSCLGSTRSTSALMQETKSGLTEMVTAKGGKKISSSNKALEQLLSEMSATTEFSPISRFSDSFLAVPSQNNHKQEVTVVVQLSGELGNHMHKIASGMCVKNQIEKSLGLKTELKFRAQESSKWKRAMQSTKEAFPNTRSFDFRAGNTEEFDQAHLLQEQWLQHLIMTNQLNLTGISDPSVMNHFTGAYMNDILTLLNQTWYMERPRPTSGGSNFSIPHVYADAFAEKECLELMLDELRKFFVVDEDAICRLVPDPDENVLHLRNFLVEMPNGAGRKLGFEELNANKTATKIFANYKPGDKVAIISRFEEKTDEYIDALKELKGIEARYIKGQTGNQDFCFLMKAQQEVIGQKLSSFANWASILGKAKKVRLYSVDSEYTRAKQRHFYNFTWNVKELRERIVYENYKA
jgi:hypothetical protein